VKIGSIQPSWRKSICRAALRGRKHSRCNFAALFAELFLARPLRRRERPFSMRRMRLPIILDRSKFGQEPINAENDDE
jgi:hypothetical protein